MPGTVPTVVSKTEGSSKVRDLNIHISHVDIYGLYLTLTSAKGGCVGSELSQCMSWGRGLVPFPETVPFFP